MPERADAVRELALQVREHLGPLALVRRLEGLRLDLDMPSSLAAESAQLRLESDSVITVSVALPDGRATSRSVSASIPQIGAIASGV